MKQRELKNPKAAPRRSKSNPLLWAGIAVLLIAIAGAAVWFSNRTAPRPRSTGSTIQPTNDLTVERSSSAPAVAIPTNEVAQALMVTVELDLGKPVPAIKDALTQIERRYEPADGVGRTFAILDAYGEPTPAGKLHMSMHVSMEKPGMGSLVFRRTGEVLWKSRIVQGQSTPQPHNLTVIMDDNAGHSVMLDGSKGVENVLDVPIHDSPARVRDLWPNGAEREFTFIYSVCGCPVKAKVRRTGETTVRSSDLPVMFPDDPEALAVIKKLMGWQ